MRIIFVILNYEKSLKKIIFHTFGIKMLETEKTKTIKLKKHIDLLYQLMQEETQITSDFMGLQHFLKSERATNKVMLLQIIQLTSKNYTAKKIADILCTTQQVIEKERAKIKDIIIQEYKNYYDFNECSYNKELENKYASKIASITYSNIGKLTSSQKNEIKRLTDEWNNKKIKNDLDPCRTLFNTKAKDGQTKQLIKDFATCYEMPIIVYLEHLNEKSFISLSKHLTHYIKKIF